MAILPFTSSLFVSLHDIRLHQSTSFITTTTTSLFTCTVFSILLLLISRTSATAASFSSGGGGGNAAYANEAAANRTLPLSELPIQRIHHHPPHLDSASSSLPRRVQLGKSADEYELTGDKTRNVAAASAATYQPPTTQQRTSSPQSSSSSHPSHPSSHLSSTNPSNHHHLYYSHHDPHHPNELTLTEENVDEVPGLEDHQLAALDGGTHVFTNQFVVEAEGAPEAVKKLAHEHGFLYLGHVSVFAHYHYANLLLSIFRIYSPSST